jgi:hypothetical protein
VGRLAILIDNGDGLLLRLVGSIGKASNIGLGEIFQLLDQNLEDDLVLEILVQTFPTLVLNVARSKLLLSSTLISRWPTRMS